MGESIGRSPSVTEPRARPRLLFVDDEPLILAGYRNALRRRRSEWELVFCERPEQALLLLTEPGAPPFDAIVSDLRMPQLDGAALLALVKERSPSTARLVLSGQTDPAAALRVLPFAQQFLQKPCEPATLEAAIQRALRIGELVSNPALRASLNGTSALPSPPSTYMELVAALEAKACSMQSVSAVIERDPAMAAKVIQLVNSAFFGLPRRVTSVREAVGLLGVQTVKAMVLASGIFELVALLPWDRVDAVRRHGCVVGGLAKSLVAKQTDACDAFLAGMLHDFGLLLLESAALARGAPLGELDHGTACALVLASWGLPHVVADAVLEHHRAPASAPGPVDAVRAVQLAERLVGDVRPEGDERASEVTADELAAAGVTDSLEALRERALALQA